MDTKPSAGTAAESLRTRGCIAVMSAGALLPRGENVPTVYAKGS